MAQKKHKFAVDPDVDPEFQIAPMIDILLVLLVFFMSISSTEVLQANRDIHLPIARDAKDPNPHPGGQVIVNLAYSTLNNSTVIEVDQVTLPGVNELGIILNNRSRDNLHMRVVIRADKQVRYEFMRTILEVVGNSNIGNVTFSVADKDNSASKVK